MDDQAGKPQSAVTWIYENSKHKGNVRYVLVTLAIAYTEKGSCLSMKEIAKRTGISQATVRRALETLETDGTIQIIKNGGEKRGNGVTNCYRIPGYDKLHGDSSQVDTSHTETPHTDTPAINAIPHVSESGDAAGEKDLSLEQEKKDKKHPLPALAGKEPGRAKPVKPVRTDREPTEAGLAYIDLLNAIREVFGAVKVEATNYANMLTGRAKKGLWGQCAFEVPVSADELRRWWRWYHGKFPNVERVKQAPLVYSSITEWREVIKPRQVAAAAQSTFPVPRMTPVILDATTGMHQTIPDSELDKLRPSWKVGVPS